ncbi:MAG: hypothetical protein JW705_08840 [Methanosarcinaceae archaeon]|nr:hypothetical protein [Methanosarcinaceae archaeon]
MIKTWPAIISYRRRNATNRSRYVNGPTGSRSLSMPFSAARVRKYYIGPSVEKSFIVFNVPVIKGKSVSGAVNSYDGTLVYMFPGVFYSTTFKKFIG